MSAIEAVLFDVGGVFTLSPFSEFDGVGPKIGAKPGQIHEIIFGNYHEDGDHPWHKVERGEISLDECRQTILELAQAEHGFSLDIYEIFAAMPRDGGIRSVLVDKVADLKARGYRRAIITNNVKEFSAGWRSLLPVDDLFELVVDSCEVGLRKPNPAIFELTLERMGIREASKTVFLDDFQGNIETAKALGMRTVHVGEDINEAIAELEALLK